VGHICPAGHERVKLYDSNFWVLSQNCEMHMLALSCLSVSVTAWNKSGSTGWISIKFDKRVL
jgi:hypothetical protein